MARIPLGAQLLATGSPRDLQRVLIAAILRSEDEMLVISQRELEVAQSYTLVTTMVEEEDAMVLTVRLR